MERDSSPVLFENMVKNASNVIGKDKTEAMIESGLLGENVIKSTKASLSHYTTAYRQDIILGEMKKIVMEYFKLWYI
jgi:hypothetical protein